jgi:glycosyltransferase A (GT-A) superfamily protein (DUF2064 family)
LNAKEPVDRRAARPAVPCVGIMAKAPRAGHAKTRLARAVSPEVAADLYYHFLLDTVAVVARVPDVAAVLICPPGDGRDLRRLDLGLPVVEQPAPGLMQGLAFGIGRALDRGHPAVALIDADSPTLPPERISAAFAALAGHDVVLGPTVDGGYYLIAATVPCTRLLCDVPYLDAATICADTLARARHLGLRATTIASWFDVDLPMEVRWLVESLRDEPTHRAVHTRRALAAHHAVVQKLAQDHEPQAQAGGP